MKSIREVTKEFNVTARTLRYYEEIGLLTPERSETNQRSYSGKEIAKLKLIIRGKRYNFNLEEMILLFDKDRTGKAQLKRTIEYGENKIKEIDVRIQELQEIKSEITALSLLFEERIRIIENEEDNQ